MACNCSKGKTGFQVIASNGNVVYESTSKATAEAIGKRYPGSRVEAKGAAAAAPAAKPAVKAEKTVQTTEAAKDAKTVQ